MQVTGASLSGPRPPRVLVVDDTPQIREVFRRFLNRSGMDVTLASDGAAGLAQARGFMPDVVVSDLRMPAMGGVELCRALRSDQATQNVPIIIVTGQDLQEAQEAADAGCDAILEKPCSAALLVATVRTLLSRPRP